MSFNPLKLIKPFLKTAFAAALALAAFPAFAQDVIINSVEMATDDPSAVYGGTARKDATGKPCAIVKVTVLADDVQFQGNVVNDVPHKGSEYWVYMTGGTRQLRFSSSKFKPVNISFSDYGIAELQGERVYKIDVTIPSETSGAALLLTVAPADATVFIDNAPTEVTDGVVTAYLKQGNHSYRIEAKGYRTEEGTIKMNNKAIKKYVRLYSTEKINVTPFRHINGKYGFKDQNDKIAVKAVYDKVIKADPVFWVIEKGKYGMINSQGMLVAKPMFDGVMASTIEGLFIVSQNGKYGVMNSNGWLTVPCMLDKISTTSSKMLVGVIQGRFGLIDAMGELVIPCENEEITDFFDGMAGVRKDGKCGFVNTEGDLVIPFEYDGISHFSAGVARVVKDGNTMYIDKNGNIVDR